MCVNMAKTIKEERLRWVLPIVRKEIKLADAGLEPKSTRPKTQPNETPIWIKERIIELRKARKKCSFKLADDLEKEGIDVSVRLIGKVLKAEGLVRKYRIRKLRYKLVRIPLSKGDWFEETSNMCPKPWK